MERDPVLDAVGPRLRTLRQRRGGTLAEISEQTGISVSTLSRLESGGRKPTLELLLPLARAYQVPLDALVGTPPGDPRIRARPVRRNGRTLFPLTRQPGGIRAYKMIIPAGEPAGERQSHEGYEWVYVLSGRLRLRLGEHDFVMRPGEAAEFDTRTPHWFGSAGAEPAELLTLFGPQGERIHVRARPRPRNQRRDAPIGDRVAGQGELRQRCRSPPTDPGVIMPPKPLEPGDPVRLGRFELLGRLGEGGQGVVYLGRGTGPGEDRVAVKVLRSTVDPLVLERLGRELEAVHQVQPFVTARIIEASSDGDRRFVVSEFIDGPSLQERVDAQGPLAEGDLLRLAVGTATALTAIHGAGVVHRDFKPANVLLGPDGPRVVDFGIARVTDAATITSGLIGTPAYVAPEQLAGVRPTSAVDIFAWAVTMMFAATGRLAFGADAVPAVMHRIMYEEPDVSDLPPSLQPVILQCLDKDPARRPTARELLLRLVDPSAQQHPATQIGPRTSWTDPLARTMGSGVPADQAPWTDPVPAMPGSTISGRDRTARSRRGPALAAAVGAAVVVALIVAGVLLLTRGSPPGHATGSGSTSAAGHTSSAAPPTSTAPATVQAAGPTIPAQFAGTWAGTATISAIGSSSFGIQNPITFTFAAGSGTAHETDQDPSSGSTCVNTLTLTRATATVLTFSEPAVAGQCVAGTVTFTKHGATLDYRWLDAAGLEQNIATLHKQKT